ncbi:hypothetical protein [Falsirhodobacter xinxiangensis]|nr:hypothetical protein [Rhodobacter xinxiangensis]
MQTHCPLLIATIAASMAFPAAAQIDHFGHAEGARHHPGVSAAT